MSSCPRCFQQVEILDQHKGTLFTCPHCTAVFFIDWNGQPEATSQEVESPLEASNEAFAEVDPVQALPEHIEVYQPEVSSFEGVNEYAPEEQPAIPSTSDTSDFSDVTDFANNDLTAGPLSYVVIIEGIDSSLLVRELREVMTDSRFGWDANELLTHISAARLVLKDLSPAKASVLINRIKYLPFKISWRQDVFSGS